MEVSKNRGGPPKSSYFNRVFHDFHHPFWGTPIFGNTHIIVFFWSLPSCSFNKHDLSDATSRE